MILGTINCQKLSLNSTDIVADTIDFIEARFVFLSDDWDGLEKWAHFARDGEVYDIRLTDDHIRKEDHLNLSSGKWKVYIHGNEFRGGEVVQRVTTNMVTLYVEPTGTLDGEPFPEMPASVTEQILARLSGVEQNSGSGGIDRIFIMAGVSSYGPTTYTLNVQLTNGSVITCQLPNMGLELADVITVSPSSPITPGVIGYVGKLWFDTTDRILYVCISSSNAIGAQNWLAVGGGGSSGGGTGGRGVLDVVFEAVSYEMNGTDTYNMVVSLEDGTKITRRLPGFRNEDVVMFHNGAPGETLPAPRGKLLFDTDRQNMYVCADISGNGSDTKTIWKPISASGVHVGSDAPPAGTRVWVYPAGKRSDIPQIDETLTKAGYAADAKAVGEKFDQLSGEIADQMVTKEELYQKVLSKNIFDFSTLQLGYLLGTSGQIYTGGSYDNYMYSEMYIPVSVGDVISFQYNVGGNVRNDSITSTYSYKIYGVAGYNADKTFVQGVTGGHSKYVVPEEISYIRVCFQASLINNTNIIDKAIVKNSNGIAIPYEEYGEYLSEIIKEEHLPTMGGNAGGNTGNLYISLVDMVHIKVNNTFKVYFRNVISRKDTMLWIGYHNSLITRYYDEYFTVSASAEGEYDLPWKVYDMAGNLLESGTLKVIVTSKVPTGTITAMVIGDSTVNDGTMTAKVTELYTADGATLSLLGTRGNGTHEGRSGWTAEMYCTTASNGGVDNPFYNNGFDFAYYMTNQNFSGVQAVAIQLGINDIFGFKDYSWAAYDSAPVLGYLNQMVTSILAYNPSIKVIINLPITPNSNGTSFTETYGTTQLYWFYNKNIIRFAKELKEYFESNSSVTVSASNCILDTKTQIRDGVHPTTDGYNELGQRLYEVLISIVDGEVVVLPLLDISARTRVKQTSGSIAATAPHELSAEKCYDSSFSGLRSAAVTGYITAYNAISSDSLSIQVNNASGYGMEFPVPQLEVGKSYTLKYTLNNTGRVYLMKYNLDTTYNTNTMQSSAAGTFTKTITPEEGYLYSIIFVPMAKDTLVTFSGISLTENT